MSFDIIEQLLRANPKKRIKIVRAQRAKNIAFLKKYGQNLSEMVQQTGTGRFEIRMDEEFLDILDRRTGRFLLPKGNVLEYVRGLGSWHHTAWIDKLAVQHIIARRTEHGKRVEAFLTTIYQRMPEIKPRMRGGVVSLPRAGKGRRYSGSVVFLGIFTGLHIAHYLNTTDIRDVVLIEPDLELFALSCSFLDYEAIEKRFGRLVLHIGPNMPPNPVDLLIGGSPETSTVWLRLLPAYPSETFDRIISRFNLRWRALTEIFIPYDLELRNIVYGMRNLRSQVPLLSGRCELSESCRIAVIGSGPSLDNDLGWLRENQDRLIIISATSTVRVLKQHGIHPDFQSMLNTEMTEERHAQLELDPEIPMVAYYKTDPEVLERFQTPLLVPEMLKASPVYVKNIFNHTHPTTGNLIIALAAYMRPAELYLLGFDLGFRDAERSHAGGTWHDDHGGKGHDAYRKWDAVPFEANFPESEGEIYTQAYHNSARNSIQSALREYGQQSHCFNLSDGTRIQGAQATHSAEIELDEYQDKGTDVQAIIGAFSAQQEDAWELYKTPGREKVARMVEIILDTMTLEKFDWMSFARALDTAWIEVLRKLFNPRDVRLESYRQFVHSLFTEWYRMMILTKNQEEAKYLYQVGMEQLRLALEALEWPSELVAWEEELAGAESGAPAATEAGGAPHGEAVAEAGAMARDH